MALRTRPLGLVLLLALCLPLAACGEDTGGPAAAGIVGHWISPAKPGREPGPPGFFNLGADGTVEQYEGGIVFQGAYEIDGDKLVLEQLAGMPPVPPMQFEVDAKTLSLSFQTPGGEQTVVLTRAGADAPPSNTKARYAELVKTLLARLDARIGEELSARGRGEQVTLGEVDPAGGGRVVANLQVPWSLGGEGVEAHSGRFEFILVWVADGWRLVRAKLRDDAHPDSKPADLLQMNQGQMPKVNESVPFAGAVWRAWQDVIGK